MTAGAGGGVVEVGAVQGVWVCVCAWRGEGGVTVKTMIAFHQVEPICYSSLKQSNLQKDNYALAPLFIYWREEVRE